MLDQYQLKTQSNFTEIVATSQEPLVIVFCSSVSGICQMMLPIFKDFEYEYGRKVKLFMIDDHAYPDHIKNFEITQFPTILFVKYGEIIDRATGIVSRKVIDEKIVQLINYKKRETNEA